MSFFLWQNFSFHPVYPQWFNSSCSSDKKGATSSLVPIYHRLRPVDAKCREIVGALFHTQSAREASRGELAPGASGATGFLACRSLLPFPSIDASRYTPRNRDTEIINFHDNREYLDVGLPLDAVVRSCSRGCWRSRVLKNYRRWFWTALSRWFCYQSFSNFVPFVNE